jgi:hypothetical protein
MDLGRNHEGVALNTQMMKRQVDGVREGQNESKLFHLSDLFAVEELVNQMSLKFGSENSAAPQQIV